MEPRRPGATLRYMRTRNARSACLVCFTTAIPG